MNAKVGGWFLSVFCLFCAAGAAAQSDEVFLKHTVKHQRRMDQQQLIREDALSDWGAEYLYFKKDLAAKTGFQYGVDVSFLGQRGAPSGKKTSVQAYYYPYLTWNVFSDTALGSGQINANYNVLRYWGADGAALQNRLGVLASPNDYSSEEEIFSQLSYTHTLPGEWNWLSFTAGQFPLYNFDGSVYLDNQQTALFNYALSQNASSTYPSASFGGYVQAAPASWTFAAGWQEAGNISGQNIRLNRAFDGRYTWFGSVSYAPEIEGLGAGQYSFLYYYQPSVAQQPGVSRGWSVNVSQDLGHKWVASARANGSDGHIASVKNSYALALTLLNPLERNANDALTLGIAYNRADKEALGYPAHYRRGEGVLELQWVWGVGKLLTITPDVQFYPKAALGSGHKFTTVAGVRTTIML